MSTVHVTLDAIRGEQSGIPIYSGIAPAKKILAVSTVDPYDSKLSPTDKKQGYQRPPERHRITKIGNYLINEDGSRLFPTAVLLASREPINYDKKTGEISLSSDYRLQIVDGQHRLEGMRYAIFEKGAKDLENFSIPFVIMETKDKLTEMTQFRIVNGTAKQVRTDLVNMILTATYSDSKRSEIPEKEQWKIVVSNVVDKLAKTSSSPWFESIGLPGEAKEETKQKIAKATSFITSLKPVYVWLKATTMHGSRSLDDEIKLMYDVVAAYWDALREVVPDAFVDPNEFVIQKTPGLFSLHKLLKHLLGDIYRGRRDFTTKTFIEFLKDNSMITSPDFWSVEGQEASRYGSMAGFEELYERISEPYI